MSLDENLEPLLIRAVESEHQEMQVHGQAVQNGHLKGEGKKRLLLRHVLARGTLRIAADYV
jgi:hypothetical protein